VEDTLEQRFTRALPQRLIGDKAYDSNQLDADLACWNIEMISPNRTGTKATQDKRVLRRYKRRWKVEESGAIFCVAGKLPQAGRAL